MTQATENQAIELMLPFYVNGTLDDAERSTVESALARDPALVREVETLAALRTQMQTEMPEYSPGELGLARLMRDIGTAEPAARPVARSGWKMAAFAAAAALAAVLIIPAMPPSPEAPVYEQASGDATEVGLVVTFRPGALQGEIADLLMENGLVIVDGPSALGIYRLSLVDEGDYDMLVERLLAQDGLIESVDRLQ